MQKLVFKVMFIIILGVSAPVLLCAESASTVKKGFNVMAKPGEKIVLGLLKE